MPDLFLPLLALGVAMSFTPGPNNLMIAASGANFGWQRSLPLAFGIVLGFMSLVLAVGFGLGVVFDRYPLLHEVLRYGGAAYLVWLGFRIATGWGAKPAREAGAAGPGADANTAGAAATRGKPIGLLQGAALQWVNPKGWVLAVGALSAYTLPDRAMAPQVLMIAAVLGVLGIAAQSVWLSSGVLARRYFRSDRALRILNLVLGGLCIASVVFIFV